MELKKIVERSVFGDPRIFYAMQEHKKNDKSFTEKGFFGIKPTFKQSEVREIWFNGISLGMQHGIQMAGLPGQKIDLYNNCKEPRQKDFLDKFYKLCEEYNCAVAYSPQDGMCVVDLKTETF